MALIPIKRRGALLLFAWTMLSLLATLYFVRYVITPVEAQPAAACAGNATIPISRTQVSVPITTVQIVEGGPPYTYTIVLCSQPQEDVTVFLEFDAVGSAQLSVTNPSAQVHFQPANFTVPQVVTVTAINDTVAETSPLIGLLRHATNSTDTNFIFTPQELPYIRFEIIDDDTGPSHLPVVLSIIPTATPTPPPAAWARIAQTANRETDVLALYQNTLVVGDRSSTASQRGIYRIDECVTGAGYTLIPTTSTLNVRDLAFRDDRGLAGINGGRVYYSTDPFNQWQQTSSSMNSNVFAVLLVDAALAYAGADDGIYRSTNGGETWAKLAGSGLSLINVLRPQTQPDRVWIGTFGSGVWTLANDQFFPINDGLPDPNTDRRVWDILVENSTVYIGTTNGIYFREQDNGPWQPFGLQGVQVLSLEKVLHDGQSYLYAGTFEQGIWRTLSANPAWQQDTSFGPTTVRDLLFDDNAEFCTTNGVQRPALLAATNDGVWIYR